MRPFSLLRRPAKPKQIGRAPILGRPRLFGGKLSDYIEVTQQHIPQIISSCVSAINRLGLHNQVCLVVDDHPPRLMFLCTGYFPCTRRASRHQSIQGRVRTSRGPARERHRSRYEFRRRRPEVVLSRIERTVGLARNVRSVHLLHW